MIDSHTADEIAKVIVEDYLLEGPKYLAIVEAVVDEVGYDEYKEAADVVASTVRATLTNLAKNFSLA